MSSLIPKFASFPGLLKLNWKSGLTIAFISVPLSVALAIASGAGPVAGIVTGVWATLIAAIFGSNNYNVIGIAGALATILFAATLAAPLGLGAAVLPLIAIVSGAIVLLICAVRADRFLYYVPGSVMYGFAAGVAISIAASQIFDATGLSAMKRTGTFLGDLALYAAHAAETHLTALLTFGAFLAGILLWKRFVRSLPPVIPAAVIGVIFGWANAQFFHLDILSLGDKFGGITGALVLPVSWGAFLDIVLTPESLTWLLSVSGVVALVSVLETLITAKLADRMTRTQSSSRRELFGLALANIGSGVMGGLPATGVFIRTGANIKAGATHRMSSAVAAGATAIIALLILPLFIYIPMAVIAAILVNTAIGLIETKEFKEYWHHERTSFLIALLVAVVTILEDAGMGVLVGSISALLLFVDSISHGRFDAILNYRDGTREETYGGKTLHIPHDKNIGVLSYSIAGVLGYIDAERHGANLRHAARSQAVASAIVRLRNLYVLDHEGAVMLGEAAAEFERAGKPFLFASASATITERIRGTSAFESLVNKDIFSPKTSAALEQLKVAA